MKKILIGLAVVLVLCVGLAAVAPFVIDLNKYKGAILSKIRPYIAQEVDFQDVDLTILKGLGVEIEGLRISDSPAFSKEAFFALDKLQVRVALFPLFKKQIKIEKIILNAPVVRLARNTKGKFNFEEILVSGEKLPPAQAPSPEKGPDEKTAGKKSSGILAGLLVDELAIRQGEIRFRDEMRFPGAGPVTIDTLDLQLESVSLKEPISISLTADVMAAGKQNFHVNGKVGPVGEALAVKKAPVDLHLKLQKLAVEKLAQRLPADLPLQPVAGNLSVTWAANGCLSDKIVSQGDIELHNLVLRQTGQGKSFETPESFSCSLSHNMTVDYPRRRISIASGSLSADGNRLVFDGTVKNFLTKPRWDVNARTKGLQAASVMDLLSGFAADMPEGLKTNGPLEITIKSNGTPQDTAFDLQLSSERLGFHLPGAGEQKSGTASGAGSVEGLRIDVRGQRQGGQLDGQCRLEAAQGGVASVPFQKLFTDVRFTTDRLKIADFAIKAFQGSLQGAGQYDIVRGKWSFQPVIKEIAVDNILDAFTSYKDDFAGSFSGRFRAAGSVREKEKLPEFLTGSFTLADGKLKNVNLIDRVLEELFGLKGVARYLTEEKRKIKRHDTTRFDALTGDLTMKGKNLHFKRLELRNIRTTRATDAVAVFEGDCSLKTRRLDLDGKILLSKEDSRELVDKSEVLEALVNREKRMVLPVIVKGTIQEPEPDLDKKYVLNALAGHYTDKAVKKGMDKLKEKIDLPEDAEKSLEESAEKILKGIFGD